MSRPFMSVFVSIADRKTVEIDNDLQRMNETQQQADALQEQTKTVNENGAVSHWSSPQQLRTWAQTQQQADQLLQSALMRGAVRGRLLFRAYQHSAYCAVRAAVNALQGTVKMSLSAVSALFTPPHPATDHDPPGSLLLSCSVLATCHASNAPGLSPVARYWQVSPEE